MQFRISNSLIACQRQPRGTIWDKWWRHNSVRGPYKYGDDEGIHMQDRDRLTTIYGDHEELGT